MTNPDNMLTMTEKDKKSSIFRFMPIEKLLTIFDTKKLFLTSPERWDDPFENYLLESNFKKNGQSVTALKDTRKAVRAQCWTQHDETDALWRIYSPQKNGVRVESSPTKLLEHFIASAPNKSKKHCFIGKVTYLGTPQLIEHLKEINPLDHNAPNIAESLLLKRTEFQHEKEIRLIRTDVKKNKWYHTITIDPTDLFKTIVFDPRINQHTFEAYKEYLQKNGYSKKIRKSTLYRDPDPMTIELD